MRSGDPGAVTTITRRESFPRGRRRRLPGTGLGRFVTIQTDPIPPVLLAEMWPSCRGSLASADGPLGLASRHGGPAPAASTDEHSDSEDEPSCSRRSELVQFCVSQSRCADAYWLHRSERGCGLRGCPASWEKAQPRAFTTCHTAPLN